MRPIVIIGIGVCLSSLLVFFRYTPPKTEANKIALPVSVISIQKQTKVVMISGFGTVKAKEQLDVRPQVSGHIVELHPALQVGGRIKQGEVLARIDPRDYQIAVDAREADLARAEFQLKLEKGNQVVAKQEWALLEEDIARSPLGQELALRKPHLKEKEAALAAAKSQLERAKLDLERTQISAPFDAVILSESIELGKYVNPQSTVVVLAGTAAAQVVARISRQELKWIATAEQRAPKATVIQTFGDGSAIEREGRFVRVLGDVDAAGRMAQVLVEIESPFDRTAGEPLLLDSFVRVEIAGREVADVFAVPRGALREGGRILIVDDGSKLGIRRVETVFTSGETSFVRGDLDTEQPVVISPVQNPLAGMLLEIINDEETPQSDGAAA